MNKEPLVSVLTPCYESSQFIERCIESVSAQDYPHIEHIVQDGGSQDGTRQILERCGGAVDWVSESDAGQSDALNKALQRCRGEILLVLNADDELLPHAVSWAVSQLAAFPDDAAVYGDQYYVDFEGKSPTRRPDALPTISRGSSVSKTSHPRRRFLSVAHLWRPSAGMWM